MGGRRGYLRRVALSRALVLTVVCVSLVVCGPALAASTTRISGGASAPTTGTTTSLPPTTTVVVKSDRRSNFVTDYGPLIASITALAIAVGGGLLGMWRRPRLRIEFSDGAGSQDRVVSDEGRHQERHWLRVRVCNGRWARTAEDTEVVVTMLRRAGHEEPTVVTNRVLGWTHYEPPKTLAIAPRGFRYLDLLGTRRPGSSDAFQTTMMLFPEASDAGRYVLPPGLHVARLLLTARDAPAVEYELHLRVEEDDWTNHERHPATIERCARLRPGGTT